MPDATKFTERTRDRLVQLGEAIRLTRRARGISRKKLAESIGMHPSNYAHIERGHKNLTVDTLLRIADGLGVELAIGFHRRKQTASAASKAGNPRLSRT